ncbi:hypothetical protein TNCV_2794341 [Trichonephila clavipes]|nr:hypothetical protein TNCV_2794341 [Trichonephila clavipes]
MPPVQPPLCQEGTDGPLYPKQNERPEIVHNPLLLVLDHYNYRIAILLRQSGERNEAPTMGEALDPCLKPSLGSSLGATEPPCILADCTLNLLRSKALIFAWYVSLDSGLLAQILSSSQDRY